MYNLCKTSTFYTFKIYYIFKRIVTVPVTTCYVLLLQNHAKKKQMYKLVLKHK